METAARYAYLTPAERIQQIRHLRPYMDGLDLGPWDPYGFWRNHGILAIPGIDSLPPKVRDDREWARRSIAREDWKKRCKRKRRVSPRFRRIVIEQAGGQCEYCGRRLTEKEVEIDHVIPVTRGGRSNLGNLAAACGDCNWSKFDYLIEEWLDGHHARMREEAAWKIVREMGLSA
jgi:5-methylcytosine-specific restriction protein A